jgi:[acyl-carrier-protein] S-malonyltransferase
MGLAFIFPGQGSQYVGMANDLHRNYPEVKKLFNLANEILGYDLAEVCFNGPEDKLRQTYITQPAIMVHSLAVTLIAGKKLTVNAAAGHSLGEFTALTYAGALSFEAGLRLVKLRGELMQTAGEMNKGTMAAIIGLNEDVITKLCEQASSVGVVQIANLNSPGQIVISGTVDGVKKAMELSKANKAKLVKELVVHGAFHSPLMEPAREKLKEALAATEFNRVRIPVYSNVTAQPYTPETGADDVRSLLYEQLSSPVRWEDIIINMVKDGVSEFIELGPGKVLQGLVKRINPNVKISGIDTVNDLS